jgi:hypothetical protein
LTIISVGRCRWCTGILIRILAAGCRSIDPHLYFGINQSFLPLRLKQRKWKASLNFHSSRLTDWYDFYACHPISIQCSSWCRGRFGYMQFQSWHHMLSPGFTKMLSLPGWSRPYGLNTIIRMFMPTWGHTANVHDKMPVSHQAGK